MAQVRRNERLEDMEERDKEEAGRIFFPYSGLCFCISLIKAKVCRESTQMYTVKAKHWPEMQTMTAQIHF